jgi:hypothetical protein
MLVSEHDCVRARGSNLRHVNVFRPSRLREELIFDPVF